MKSHNNNLVFISYCYLCNKIGDYLYCNLKDRLFGCAGSWNFRKCTDCGLLWLDPKLSPEQLGKAYENYYTHLDPVLPTEEKPLPSLRQFYQQAQQTYLAENYGYNFSNAGLLPASAWLFKFLPWRRELLRKSVMWLPWKPGGKLLDVGCGNGKFLSRMRGLGWEGEGVEIDPQAVIQARAQGLTVRQGVLEEQKYPENSFDAITLNHVIEHVHDPVGLLRECHRLLKPGGRLVIATPNPASWGHKMFREHWRGLEPPRHLFLYSRKVMAELLQRAAINAYEMKTLPTMAPGIFIASRNISRQGRHDSNIPIPISEKLLARAFALLERWKLKIDPDAGEELVVIARKES